MRERCNVMCRQDGVLTFVYNGRHSKSEHLHVVVGICSFFVLDGLRVSVVETEPVTHGFVSARGAPELLVQTMGSNMPSSRTEYIKLSCCQVERLETILLLIRMEGSHLESIKQRTPH